MPDKSVKLKHDGVGASPEYWSWKGRWYSPDPRGQRHVPWIRRTLAPANPGVWSWIVESYSLDLDAILRDPADELRTKKYSQRLDSVGDQDGTYWESRCVGSFGQHVALVKRGNLQAGGHRQSLVQLIPLRFWEDHEVGPAASFPRPSQGHISFLRFCDEHGILATGSTEWTNVHEPVYRIELVYL